MSNVMVRAATFLAAIALIACDSCNPKTPGPEAKPTATPTSDTTGKAGAFGVIEGTVRLAEAQEVPEILPSMMYLQVLQQSDPLPTPKECTPAKQTDRRPVTLGPGNVLGSIFLAASDFKTAVTRAPKVHEVTIRDCRLTPMIVGAMRGDTLLIKSETDYPFMPQLGTGSYFETMIKGQERRHTLEALGAQEVLCGFTAPCGRADIITVSHPLYAITDPAGHFRIEGVPANETMNFNAWHPLFNATTHSVSVGAGETKHVEFVLTPRPEFTPSGQEAERRRVEEAQKPRVPGTYPE